MTNEKEILVRIKEIGKELIHIDKELIHIDKDIIGCRCGKLGIKKRGILSAELEMLAVRLNYE